MLIHLADTTLTRGEFFLWGSPIIFAALLAAFGIFATRPRVLILGGLLAAAGLVLVGTNAIASDNEHASDSINRIAAASGIDRADAASLWNAKDRNGSEAYLFWDAVPAANKVPIVLDGKKVVAHLVTRGNAVTIQVDNDGSQSSKSK